MKAKHILMGLLAATLTACGGGRPQETGPTTLKEAFGDYFLVGTAMNTRQVAGEDPAAAELVRTQFNAVVAENCMKCEAIHPEEDRYDFADGDALVDFAEANGLTVTGHCLVWHSQMAPWFCVDDEGKLVAPEVLKQRMKDHITTIVQHYKGRIKGWDVVNEAIVEDGSYRRSPLWEILGEEFVPLAFQYAHEADPDVELYYNDYGMNVPGRRDAVVRLVKTLQERGLRIDAVGMQGHMGMDYPLLEDLEASIEAFAATGVKVMITEWDMTALPTISRSANISDTVAFQQQLNPYPDGLPDDVDHLWNRRMKAFFELFLKHADVISRVTAWGVSDGDSWRNYFPMDGRTDYALLFDRQHRMKPFLKELMAPKTARFTPLTYSVSGEEPGDGDVTVGGTAIANPLLPGCYPDPSICRVGNDYYLVNSTFAYSPGVPIWHSTDLRTWDRLGFVLDRPSQLPLRDGLPMRCGIYAPDIKYNPHNGLFYLITTDVFGRGTLFVTTDDPKKGRWSEPTYLPEVGGIDPSFLFDNDGRAYIVNNDAPIGKPLYDGHRAIWMREFDWKTGRTVGRQRVIVNGGVDIRQEPSWIEGPHLYHIGDTYYLMCAEGGTGTNHSEVVFSARSPQGPFTPCKINPILTQRDAPADRPNPVTCTGHADLVQTAEGDWYAVFLAVRPYRDGHDVMGRETYIHPVEWVDGQPVILPEGETLTCSARPVADAPLWSAEGLSKEAFGIRSLKVDNSMIDPQGQLTLSASSVRLADGGSPSVMGRWVTDYACSAQTSVCFSPQSPGDLAGLTLFQDELCHVTFGLTADAEGSPCLKLTALAKGETKVSQTVPLEANDGRKPVHLKVEGILTPASTGHDFGYQFSYSLNPTKGWTAVGDPVPADYLSTRTAGGFTGTMVGVYATGNYQTSSIYP